MKKVISYNGHCGPPAPEKMYAYFFDFLGVSERLFLKKVIFDLKFFSTETTVYFNKPPCFPMLNSSSDSFVAAKSAFN